MMGIVKGILSQSGGGHMLVFAFFFIYLPINVPTLAGSRCFGCHTSI